MMKSTVGRLYVAAIAVLVFFLFWATVSAHPWAGAAKVDPRVADLQAREHNVRVEVAKAKAAVTHRWAVYNKKLKHRKVAIARAEKKRAAAFARARAIALSRRRVVYRTVVGGSGGGRSYSGGSSGGGGGYSGGGGGSSSGGGSAAAPPVVSVGGGAPVSSSGTS
jgi:uncharacterized membrane protein YgcG